VIVDGERLAELAGSVTMVDGGFDPLHPGHIGYFRAAAALGRPVLCNVAPDRWVARKHPPLLAQRERCELIDAIRYVDYTHAAHGTTAGVLAAVRPHAYAKGADWRGNLPAEELELCARLGIEVVFLDTVVDSSTDILRRYTARL
jgi:cytidyltransferase-like protein